MLKFVHVCLGLSCVWCVLFVYPLVTRAVGNILDNLHDIAVDMGDELGRQNEQLVRIDQKASVDVAHIGQANRRMQNQM